MTLLERIQHLLEFIGPTHIGDELSESYDGFHQLCDEVEAAVKSEPKDNKMYTILMCQDLLAVS